MLQRLYASLVRGPSLNARPHHSRQRLDLTEIDALDGLSAASLMDSLMGTARSVDCPAKVSSFNPPSTPEKEWSSEQKQAQLAFLNQSRLLNKFQEISADARDYFNDHGEDALFVAYPLLSVPAIQEPNGPSSPRVLAPIAFMPVSLDVKRGTRKGIHLKATGEGADLLIPNPSLLAWLEQQTGKEIDDLFGDEDGEDPWKELREILGLVTSALGIRESFVAPRLPIESIPKIRDLPSVPAVLPCAVLGLFPTTNPGLMRDTKWMMERPDELTAPVSLFLNQRVLEPRDAEAERDESEGNIEERAPVAAGFESESLVTQADPCQAEAVLQARMEHALVIHGPPGTGKSQTIANIIGDHLAREKRVLFVCDKRTAIDVVKYRLDALGLGDLCGVVHDVQRDRRALYMGIRERLDQLTDEAAPKSPIRRLQNVNDKLNALRDELRSFYDTLHSNDEERRSFHDLVGDWMVLRGTTNDACPELLATLNREAKLSEDGVENNLADIDECLQHAISAELGENPFHGRLKLTLSELLGGEADDLEHLLDQAGVAAGDLDAGLDGNPLRFTSETALSDQESLVQEIISQANRVRNTWSTSVVAAVFELPESSLKEWDDSAATLTPELASLEQGIDRSLELACPVNSVPLAKVNEQIQALEDYREAASRWTRVFAFGKRKAAQEILAPLGLELTVESLERGLTFVRQLRASLVVGDFLGQMLGSSADSVSSSDLLSDYRAAVASLSLRRTICGSPLQSQLTETVSDHLGDHEQFASWIHWLQKSHDRVDLIRHYQVAIESLRIFDDATVAENIERACQAIEVSSCVKSWQRFRESLEDVLRFERRSREMPEALRDAVKILGAQEIEPSLGVQLLRRIAVERTISGRLKAESKLGDITSERVEAALKEFGQRLAQKEALVRELALFHWQGVQHDRLVADSGSRLSSLGASLRQRLFIRGKRALKLRQMVRTGQDIAGGDPLFDVCPVWMASPSTVAQIFPREAQFDLVIFDEASQCRLEEALPVLLRGKRVVIAGDPKQLPPTRFFESAIGDSEFADAESLEELHEQQMSETEDLLTAALNLDLHSSYLDVHYRSQSEALIGFSNEAFYHNRLQPLPGHPDRLPKESPLKVYRVDGTYKDRSNPDEAEQVSDLVVSLLAMRKVPSIGIACFNLNQRDLILRALERRAASDKEFAERLDEARNRQGNGSFEGLFVKNLENVQGDERDHLIISTTFGPGSDGKFRRHFGALSRAGGERRLNVLVTRARERIHVLTSIPREEYTGLEESGEPVSLTGRHYLYRFLRFAEIVEARFGEAANQSNPLVGPRAADAAQLVSASVSVLAEQVTSGGLVQALSPWGNEGFCVDLALVHPDALNRLSYGIFLDFNRYRKTMDPIKWEHFRTDTLRRQGWKIRRVWTPELFRKGSEVIEGLVSAHQESVGVEPTEPEVEKS